MRIAYNIYLGCSVIAIGLLIKHIPAILQLLASPSPIRNIEKQSPQVLTENSKMQKALFVTEIGKPMVIDTRPIPTPKEGQVLIKITATMILPHDTYARDFGLFIAHKLPYIVGNNLAGIVQAYGPNTPHRYPVDSHIFGFAGVNNPVPDEAGLQQYAALDLPATGAVPASLTDDQLVTLPVNAVTSFIALFHPTSGFGLPDPTVETKEKSSGGSDPASGSIVIIGAGTHVGKLAIQFAKLAGVAKIIGVASVSRSKELEQAGASHVVDRHLPVAEIVAQVHAAAGGANNVTRVYDCRSSTRDLDVALLPVDVPSLFLSLRPIDEGTEKTIKETKPKAGAKLVMGTSEGLGAMQEGFWKELPKWAEKGIVGFPEVRIVKGLDEGEVNGGLDAYRDQSAGKGVVVHPNA